MTQESFFASFKPAVRKFEAGGVAVWMRPFSGAVRFSLSRQAADITKAGEAETPHFQAAVVAHSLCEEGGALVFPEVNDAVLAQVEGLPGTVLQDLFVFALEVNQMRECDVKALEGKLRGQAS